MDRTVWQNTLLERLEQVGQAGQSAAAYLRRHKTRIGFRRARLSVGAFWTVAGNIHLNSRRYSTANTLSDPYVLCLVLHEARHLQQGFFTALSVYGELEAWQLHFTVYHSLVTGGMHAAISELLALPLRFDRSVLRRARALMQVFAGKKYRIDLLPLFPLGKEIAYWLGLRYTGKITGS